MKDDFKLNQQQMKFSMMEDPPDKGMVTHSSSLAWRISGTEESGRLQSMGFPRVGVD